MDGATYDDPEDFQVCCPRCGKLTDHIQDCDVPILAFLFVYIAWNTEKLVGCPPCVRSGLLQRLLISIPLSNIACCLIVP